MNFKARREIDVYIHDVLLHVFANIFALIAS